MSQWPLDINEISTMEVLQYLKEFSAICHFGYVARSANCIFNKSNVKRRNTHGYLDQYTAPNSKYTELSAPTCPTPPQMEVSAPTPTQMQVSPTT